MAECMHKIRSAAFASGLTVLLGTTALGFSAAAQTAPDAAPPPAAAPAAPPAPPVPVVGVVGRIVVQGNERIEASTLQSYMPINVGETVDAARLDLALRTLFQTQLFADVKIDLVGTDLVVRVVENPIINQVVFEGNSALKEDKLRDEVTVRPRGIFTRARVAQDVGRIIELYRRSGRISATVTPEIVELPQRRVDLIFRINEGPKSGVLRVNFLGNSAVSDDTLRGVIVTEESHWYRFFSTNDNYDPDRIEYDREQIRKYYRNRGFYDFRIISSTAELAPSQNGFAVTYALEEGQRYRFGRIRVETQLSRLNRDVLQQLVPIRSGSLYSDDAIEHATDALTFAAGAAGFAFVDVRPRYVPNRENHTIDVVFDVREGPRVYVERIDVVGNNQTLDYVIRREMNVSEGDAYNRVLVDRSRNQIRALGYFRDVTIEQLPGSAPDRTRLVVHVTEQPNGEVSFSAGYSSVDQLVVDLGISQRNFRGRGQDLRAQLSIGSLRQQINFSFSEPRFLGRNLRAGIDLYSYRYNFSNLTSYDTATTGGTLRLGFPLTVNASMSTRYTLRSDQVIVDQVLCIPGQEVVSVVLCQQRGTYVTSLLGYSARLDMRNDPVTPTRGFYVDLSQDMAGVGGDVHYIRTEADGGWYYGFTPAFVLQVTGSVGYVAGWNGDAVRISDRFYKGGNSFRGFETAGIGPRDTQFGDALGGNFYAIGSAELSVPTGLPEQYGIRAALFTDVGTLGLLDRNARVDPNTNLPISTVNDDLALRASAGVSIFWRSPMGPLRFDFSQVLARTTYDKTETFRFSTAQRF